MNAIGCIIRMLASLVMKNGSRYWLALIGQIISASSQPLVLPMPTKVAAVWFGENERTTANTIAFIGISLLHSFIVFYQFSIPFDIVAFSIHLFIRIILF